MTRRLPVDAGTLQLGRVALDKETSHYAGNVLRLGLGDAVSVFDGAGHVGTGTFEGQWVVVDDLQTFEPPTPSITLYQAIPKGERWEWLLEKATELGVSTIVPIQTQWSVVTIDAGKTASKLQRWERVVTAAARQSERMHTPAIAAPRSLKAAAADAPQEVHWLAHPGGQSPTRVHAASVAIWIGPEAGFSPADLELLDFATRVSLGDTILRSETAGAFAVGLARHLCGAP